MFKIVSINSFRGMGKSNEMVSLASSSIFSVRFPDHPLTKGLRNIIKQIKA